MRFNAVFLGIGLAAGLLDTLRAADAAAPAAPRACRLIVDAATGKTLLRQGPCDVRWTPCSTFKIPLAVIGFDSGILQDAHQPAWDYVPGTSDRAEDQQTIDPTSWEKISVVWYSRKLTRTLGAPAFGKYIDRFNYGNRDLTGDPGKDNGLTQAWIMSSLLISPQEQVDFLRQLLDRKLPVSARACELTEQILPSFPSRDGWTLTGKTGSGFQKKPDGTSDRSRNIGWFVGWATKGDRRLIFADLLIDETPHEGYGGLRAREELLRVFPDLLPAATPAGD